MADSAEVHSLEILRELRVALVLFGEDASLALQDVDFEIRRTLEWLGNEQRLYWQSEIRRGQQKLTQARAELHRKKLSKFSDRQPDTTQEEKAVKRAERRLETAQQKLERVKRWIPELQHAITEYRGRTQGLSDASELLIPRQVARLDRMILALEEYAQINAPRADDAAGVGRSAGTAASSMSRDVADPGLSEPIPPPSSTSEGSDDQR